MKKLKWYQWLAIIIGRKLLVKILDGVSAVFHFVSPVPDSHLHYSIKSPCCQGIVTLNIDLYNELRKVIFLRDNYTCRYCRQIGGLLEVDHIIPLSKGGNSSEDNLTTACRKCNRQKRNKSEDEFIAWRVKSRLLCHLHIKLNNSAIIVIKP